MDSVKTSVQLQYSYRQYRRICKRQDCFCVRNYRSDSSDKYRDRAVDYYVSVCAIIGTINRSAFRAHAPLLIVASQRHHGFLDADPHPHHFSNTIPSTVHRKTYSSLVFLLGFPSSFSAQALVRVSSREISMSTSPCNNGPCAHSFHLI